MKMFCSLSPSLLIVDASIVLMTLIVPTHSFVMIDSYASKGPPATTSTTSLKYNPDPLADETPAERKARMDLVRQIQETFYETETNQQHNPNEFLQVLEDDQNFVDGSVDCKSSNNEKHQGDTCHGCIIEKLPIFRVNWSELPGYQRILEIQDPYHTHMFRRIFHGPQPWRFGILYLPDDTAVSKDDTPDNPYYELRETNYDHVPKIGTIVQISDVIEDEDAGRFGVIVQAVDRFEIVGDAIQHFPYAVANVQVLPDDEFFLDQESLADKNDEDSIEGAQLRRMDAMKNFDQWTEWELRPRKWTDRDETGSVRVPPLADYNFQFLAKKSKATTRTTATSAVTKKSSQELDPLIAELEYKMWVEVDTLYHLLAKNYNINPNLLSQLLELLPSDLPHGMDTWPEGFQFANDDNIEKEGKISVRPPQLDPPPEEQRQVATSSPPNYPPLRRVRRFSFVIWSLLESAMQLSSKRGVPTRQELLETTSIAERLGLAYHTLSDINQSLAKAQ